MMMHPASVKAIRTMIDNLMSGKKPSETSDWVSLKL
jgi:CO dehydrogenase/acetyl-CoA synthase delta subunit